MIIDGKVVKTVMREFSLAEISAVDSPAQKGARAVLLKREARDLRAEIKELAKNGFSMALTTMVAGHSHLITMGGGQYVQRAGHTDYSDGHSHPWLMDEAGNITVGHAMGHNHGIEIVSKSYSEDEDADASEDDDSANDDQAADGIGNDEDQSMTPEEKKAAEAAAAKKQHDEIATLTKRAERAEKVANLSDAHRAYFKGLRAEDAEAFLAADDFDRDGLIQKANEANKVVYTAADGTVYRKSDDPRLVKMAQQVDASERARRQSEEVAKRADLEKRASELTHIPGDLDTHIALLKGIDSLPEDQREKALAGLKAQNERLGKSFLQVGHNGNEGIDSDEVLDPIEKIATEIAKRDGITFEQAYSKALDTKEGQKAYEKHVSRSQTGV